MATFSSTTFNAAGYLAFRPSYPTWVYQLIAQYHATARVDARTVLAAQRGSLPSALTHPPPLASGVRWARALDVGCGPGIGSLPLLAYFDSVTAVDPSKKMIDQALRDPLDPALPDPVRPQPLLSGSNTAAVTGAPPRSKLGSISYLVDDALSLSNYLGQFGVHGGIPVPEEAQVDLIVAFQAAHWFTPYSTMWETFNKVLRPGGSVVFVIYSEFYLPEYPALTRLITQYTQGKPWPDQEDGLGPYWEPGRQILNNGMIDLPAPWAGEPRDDASLWDKSSFVRRVFSNASGTATTPRWPAQTSPAPEAEGARGGAPVPEEDLAAASELTMSKPADWDTLRGYLTTFSSLHNFKRDQPDDAQNHGGIIERFLRRLQTAMLTEARAAKPSASLPETFTLQWPVHIVAVKKCS